MKRCTILLSCLLLLILSDPSVGGSKDQEMIGYRNDTTGVYPADCEPVTTWNEMDFKTGKVRDRRGRIKDGLVPDKPNPVNIVWKTPLDNYCNGGFVLAGGKLFVQSDRGGVGYARDIVPDFLGNRLSCLDPKTGKILWHADLHHLDQLEPDLAKQVEADLREINKAYVEGYGGFLAFRKVAGPLVGGGHGMPDYSEKAPEGFDQDYEKEAKAFSGFWPGVPKTVEEFRKFASENKRAKRMFTWNYTQLAFGNLMKEYRPELKKKREGLGQYGYDWCAWYGQGSYVGAGMQTPVSDGKHIYVHTGYNDVFCYDLDGNRKWVTWFGPMGDHHGTCLGSPVLVGDVLIVNGGADKSLNGGNYVRGLDKNTGKVLWTVEKFDTGSSYTRITPVALTLPIEGTDQTVDVVWTGPGNVIRARDGKILATDIGCHGNGRHVGVSREKNIIVMANGSSDGGKGSAKTWPEATIAVQLIAKPGDSGDPVVSGKLLWQERRGPVRLVVKDNIVYGFGGRNNSVLEARDLMTGKVLGQAKLGRGQGAPHHFSVIAGDYLFGMDYDGQCLVAKIGAEPKIVAHNRLGERIYGKYDFFNEGSQMFFSGNRIFAVSYTDIYCIGDPA
ncbi:MAG: PQQ-binding-like beta-propeller repeat protein, partial [Planctomycetota bacterium]